LDEELKKEIEELKKEEEKKKEEASEEEKSQEDLSKESKKEPAEKAEEEDFKKSHFRKGFKSLNFYLKLFGIILALLGIIAGVFVLNKLLSKTDPKIVKEQITQTKKENASLKDKYSLKNKEEKITKEKEGASVVKLPISKEKEKNKKKYYYTVTIFPLIIPISEKNFLKVEITLFYSNYQETVLCRKKLLLYKEFFYTFLKKVPPDVWYDSNKIEKISEEAIKSLRRTDIRPIPAKIRLDGAILKA